LIISVLIGVRKRYSLSVKTICNRPDEKFQDQFL